MLIFYLLIIMTWNPWGYPKFFRYIGCPTIILRKRYALVPSEASRLARLINVSHVDRTARRKLELRIFLFATFTFRIMHLICPPKFCITFGFHFSWVLQPSQAKQGLCKIWGVGGQIRFIIWNVEVVYKSFGCPQLTSSSCDVRVHFRVARDCYFKCECKCCGTLSCFIHKCVSLRLFTVKTLLFPKICALNSCYTEANQQWICSFPADRCDRLIKSKTGFSSVHPSAVEPESELRPK